MAGHGNSGARMVFIIYDLEPSTYSSKVQKSVSSARSDDIKNLKGMVLDWITERGSALNLHLSRNVNVN